MAQYRFLQDAYIGQLYYQAGDVAATQDESLPNNSLPIGWKPNNNVEPLNAAAVTDFYAQGPRPLDQVRTKLPTTFWRPVPGTSSYQLTGLGAALPPVST